MTLTYADFLNAMTWILCYLLNISWIINSFQEIGKCIKQLLRCYSLNRRASNPMQFYVTNFGGKSKAEMEKHSGYKNWDVSYLLHWCDVKAHSYLLLFHLGNIHF